ncbi:MAG TPA: MAPEG family protein [Gammaproteobacteria bacterium]|nr:MAPEG family protein [Gammaproteobacteria bacterium]
MTYAYWYLFLVMLLPYSFALLAKFGHTEFNNKKPRDFLENLEGWRKRSHWVQLNSYEMFAPFAASVIIAHLAQVPQQRIDVVALVFLILRVLYGLFYIWNKSLLRSLSWFCALGCIVTLYILASWVTA